MQLSKLPQWFLEIEDSLYYLNNTDTDVTAEEIIDAINSPIVVCAEDCDDTVILYGVDTLKELNTLLKESLENHGLNLDEIEEHIQWIYSKKRGLFMIANFSYSVTLEISESQR